MVLQIGALNFGFHPFGDDFHSQSVFERDDALRNQHIAGFMQGIELACKRPVDFELIQRQHRQLGSSPWGLAPLKRDVLSD
jgi:hypothetical protein